MGISIFSKLNLNLVNSTFLEHTVETLIRRCILGLPCLSMSRKMDVRFMCFNDFYYITKKKDRFSLA